jgi:hypothetical protein
LTRLKHVDNGSELRVKTLSEVFISGGVKAARYESEPGLGYENVTDAYSGNVLF